MATKKATKKSVTVKPIVSSASLDGFTSKLSEKAFVGSLLIEVLGTFLLTLAFIATSGNAIVVLFAMVAVVLTLGTKNAVFFNPALSIAAFFTKNLNGFRTTMYVIGQFLGAVLAYGVLKYFVDGADTSSMNAMLGGSQQLFQIQPLPAGKEWYVALAEAIGALVLGYAFASAMKSKSDKMNYAFTVATATFLALIFASTAVGHVAGSAVLNPAITSVLGVNFSYVNGWTYWAYLVAPVAGAFVGFLLNKTISTEK